MRVAIVVVNYRTPQLVCDCLDSLAPEQGQGLSFHVFVGDALSGDGSVEKISTHIAAKGYDWASCFDLGANGGFAAGNNLIVAHHVLPDPGFEYVHFLNPDTYIHLGAVRALATFLSRHPAAGVVGSKLENPDGSARAYGFRFPTPLREFFRGARLPKLGQIMPSSTIKIDGLTQRREVDWVSGASFMVRRTVLDQVGLMDGQYFLYFEEVDFMYRIRKAGFEIWHEPESRVVHIAGQATGVKTDRAAPEPMPAYWFQSRWKFFADTYGRPAATLATVLFFIGNLIYCLHRAIRFKPISNPPKLWQSYLRYGFSMPPRQPSEPGA